MSITTGQTLWSLLTTDNKSPFQASEIDNHEQTFLDFLKTTTIHRKRGRVDAKARQDTSCFEIEDTTTFVIKLIQNFILNGIDSSEPFLSVEHNEKSFPTLDFLIDCVRGPFWLRFCSLIGRHHFANMIQTTELFLCKSLLVYWAFLQNETPLRNLSKSNLSKSGMMYRTGVKRRNCQFIIESNQQLLSYLHHPNTVNLRNPPKRSRLLMTLLRHARVLDSKINYTELFLAQVTHSSEVHSSFGTPLHSVVNFTIKVLDKLFTPKFIGCIKNRKVLRRFIVEFLKSRKKTSLLIPNLMKELNLSSIWWLGRVENTRKLTRHHIENLAFRLLKWLFTTLVPRAIRQFWYVTESSAKVSSTNMSVSFIPHDDWKKISETWLRSYQKDYLTELKVPLRQPRYKQGILRLVPKKGDFRPLCISLRYHHFPQKKRLSPDEIRKSHYFDRHVLGSVRDAIRFQQTRKALFQFQGHQKCFSVNEVAIALNKFRTDLIDRHGKHFKRLHAIKFDMKHCYDNINQAKVIQCVRNLFLGEEDRTLFLKKGLEYSDCNLNHARMSRVIAQVSQLERVKPANLFEKSTFVKAFQKPLHLGRLHVFDLLDVVLDQIANSVIHVKLDQMVCSRKRGVSQGSPLLATFCDVLYDQLVHDAFKDSIDMRDSLLIRLADDFLILSPNQQTCQIIFEKACSESFRQFGAYVNQEKSQMFLSTGGPMTVSFVGLNITIPSLDILRDLSVSSQPPSRALRSLSHILRHLLWSFRLKLRERLNDGDAVPILKFELVVEQALYHTLRSLEIYNGKAKFRSIDQPLQLKLFRQRILLVIHEVAVKGPINAISLAHFSNFVVKKICKMIDASVQRLHT